MTTPSDHSKKPAPDPNKAAAHGPDDALSHEPAPPRPEDSAVDLGHDVGKADPLNPGAPGSSGGISVVDWASLVEDVPAPPAQPPTFDAPSDAELIFQPHPPAAAPPAPPAAPEEALFVEEPEDSTLAEVHMPPAAPPTAGEAAFLSDDDVAAFLAEANPAPPAPPASAPGLSHAEIAFIEENSVTAAPPSGVLTAESEFITEEMTAPPAPPVGPPAEPAAAEVDSVVAEWFNKHEAGASSGSLKTELDFVEENSATAAPPSGVALAEVDYAEENAATAAPASGPIEAEVDFLEEEATSTAPALPPPPRKSVFEKAEAEAAAFATPEEVAEDVEFTPEKMFADAPHSPPALPPVPRMELDSGRRLDEVVELGAESVVGGASGVDLSGVIPEVVEAEDEAVVAEVVEADDDSGVMAEVAEVEDVVEAEEVAELADVTEVTEFAEIEAEEAADVAEVAEEEVLELGAEAVAADSSVNLSAVVPEVVDSAIDLGDVEAHPAGPLSSSQGVRATGVQDPGASGRDLIAEAVESGVDGTLQLPGMDIVDAEVGLDDEKKGAPPLPGQRAPEATREIPIPPPVPEPDDFFAPAESAVVAEDGEVILGGEAEVVAEESSSIDLGSMPEMPILPSAPGASAEAADIDMEALQDAASSSQRGAGKADAHGEIDLDPTSASTEAASDFDGEVISEEAVVEVSEEDESFATIEEHAVGAEEAGSSAVNFDEVVETDPTADLEGLGSGGIVREDAAVIDEEAPAEEAAVLDENLLDQETGFAEEPVEEEEEEPRPRGKRGKPEARAKGRGGAWVGGTFLGTLIGAGACVGLLVSGYAPEPLKDLVGVSKKTTTTPPVVNKGDTTASASPDSLIAKGDFQGARAAAENLADKEKKELALARIEFTEAAEAQAKAAGDKVPKLQADDKIKSAIDKLTAVKTPDAYFELGLIHEETGNLDEALNNYKEGEKSAPDAEKARFRNAIRNIDRRKKQVGEGGLGFLHRPGLRPDQAEAALVALLLVALQAPGADGPDMPKDAAKPKEAGYRFYDALDALAKAKAEKDPTMAAQQYAEAIKALQEAATLHARNRLLRRGLQQNPDSDPREQIFLDCVEELKAYWALRERLAKDHQIVEADLGKGIKDAITKGAGAGSKDLIEKLVKEKLIDKPEDFDKAVNQLIDQRKALVEKLEIKDVDAFFKDKGGLDQLADERKVLADVVKAIGADKLDGVKATVEGLVEDSKLVKKVGDKLKEDKVIDKFEKRDDVEAGVTGLVTEWKTIPGLKKDLDDSKKELTEARTFVNKVFGVLVKAEVFKEDDKQPETPVVLGMAENIILMAKGKKEIIEVVRANADLTMKNASLTTQLAALDKKRIDELAALDKKRIDELAEQDKKNKTDVATLKADHEKMVTDLKTAHKTEADTLKTRLSQSRTPEQMLPLWLPLLESRDNKNFVAATAKAAQTDAERVLAAADKKKEDEALAKALQGLALRNLGMYAEAEAKLKECEKDLPKDGPWAAVVGEALLESKDAVAYYGKKAADLADHNYPDRAIQLIDTMLKAAPAEQKGQLLAQRSLLSLEIAMAGGRAVEGNDALVKQAIKDAKDAGDVALAHYALGRIYEELRKPDDALAEFTKAVDQHKAEDADSFRFRAAKARALTAPRLGPRPAVDAKPPDEKIGRRAADENADAVALAPGEEERLALVLLTVLLEPPCPVPASLFPVDADAAPGVPEPSPEQRQAEELADKILADPKSPGDARAQALLIKGRNTEALRVYAEWLQKNQKMRADQAAALLRIINQHPRLSPKVSATPNPLAAENYWGTGLRSYYAGRYAEAEELFLAAVDADEEDARYFYFLGLAQLAQGKKKDATQNFADGAALERRNNSRVAVNASLERVQGSLRRALDEERNRVPVP